MERRAGAGGAAPVTGPRLAPLRRKPVAREGLVFAFPMLARPPRILPRPVRRAASRKGRCKPPPLQEPGCA